MSTRPLRPQAVIPDDPGPCSGILEVLQRRGGLPGRRRAEPPNGLMVSPLPRTSLEMPGLDDASPIVGVGRIRVVAAAREPAIELDAVADGVTGVSRMIRRTWSVPGLELTDEQRPDQDPAAAVEAPVALDSLADGELPASARRSADGDYAVVPVTEPPRYQGLAIIRIDDRAIMRYIRFARCGTWAADGTLVIGGEWGLLSMVAAPPVEG
ncbi:MAG: hypothetical protein KDC36_00135 [Thermoleophilia bacterium]|nr:hypothetical protein [Thermoleophilia bacterium]